MNKILKEMFEGMDINEILEYLKNVNVLDVKYEEGILHRCFMFVIMDENVCSSLFEMKFVVGKKKMNYGNVGFSYKLVVVSYPNGMNGFGDGFGYIVDDDCFYKEYFVSEEVVGNVIETLVKNVCECMDV